MSLRGTKPKFEGECKELMLSAVYDCSGSKQFDQFIKATKLIAGQAGRCTYKYGGDISGSILSLQTASWTIPVSPIGGDTFPAHFNQNVLAVNAVVWGPCTDLMRQKVEATN